MKPFIYLNDFYDEKINVSTCALRTDLNCFNTEHYKKL